MKISTSVYLTKIIIWGAVSKLMRTVLAPKQKKKEKSIPWEIWWDKACTLHKMKCIHYSWNHHCTLKFHISSTSNAPCLLIWKERLFILRMPLSPLTFKFSVMNDPLFIHVWTSLNIFSFLHLVRIWWDFPISFPTFMASTCYLCFSYITISFLTYGFGIPHYVLIVENIEK